MPPPAAEQTFCHSLCYCFLAPILIYPGYHYSLLPTYLAATAIPGLPDACHLLSQALLHCTPTLLPAMPAAACTIAPPKTALERQVYPACRLIYHLCWDLTFLGIISLNLKTCTCRFEQVFNTLGVNRFLITGQTSRIRSAAG